MTLSEAYTDSPLVEPIQQGLTAHEVFQRLSHLPFCIFFDSAMQQAHRGRYSFVAADPFSTTVRQDPSSKHISELAEQLESFSCDNVEGLPPFQGGLAGLFGYEWGGSFESIPVAAVDEFQVPVLALGWYDVVAAFDHQTNEAWLISQGAPEQDPLARRERATSRMKQFHQRLANPPMHETEFILPGNTEPVAESDLARFYSHSQFDGVTSTFSQADYQAAVARVIEYIRDGDVFQVNLSQRLLAPQRTYSPKLYQRLRENNPAPFAGYFDIGDFQILSASPERFLKVDQGTISTHPIKGTRQRSQLAEADLFTGDELVASQKDRAENTMIVDLLRNDLSRICKPDSVFVEKLCGLERFQFVQHLVSVITGKLNAGISPLQLFPAAFPGGSITGAPKIRAMEIIAELEPTVRGPYCGSLGYIGFSGKMDSNILIRTITAGRGWYQIPVGGGVIAQSVPRDEFLETCHKARGLIDVL